MVLYTCNSSYSEARQEDHRFKVSLGNRARKRKGSLAWKRIQGRWERDTTAQTHSKSLPFMLTSFLPVVMKSLKTVELGLLVREVLRSYVNVNLDDALTVTCHQPKESCLCAPEKTWFPSFLPFIIYLTKNNLSHKYNLTF